MTLLQWWRAVCVRWPCRVIWLTPFCSAWLVWSTVYGDHALQLLISAANEGLASETAGCVVLCAGSAYVHVRNGVGCKRSTWCSSHRVRTVRTTKHLRVTPTPPPPSWFLSPSSCCAASAQRPVSRRPLYRHHATQRQGVCQCRAARASARTTDRQHRGWLCGT